VTEQQDTALALTLAGLTAIAIGRVWPDPSEDREAVTVEIE
jgi:hypothetical protein